jgi:hypothetical protein
VSASGWMSAAEWLTRAIVWYLARVTGGVTPNWQFANKVKPPKNPSPPARLKVSVEGIGVSTPGKPRRNGRRHRITEGAAQSRETRKAQGVIFFITGFATDQRLLVRSNGRTSLLLCDHPARKMEPNVTGLRAKCRTARDVS